METNQSGKIQEFVHTDTHTIEKDFEFESANESLDSWEKTYDGGMFEPWKESEFSFSLKLIPS